MHLFQGMLKNYIKRSNLLDSFRQIFGFRITISSLPWGATAPEGLFIFVKDKPFEKLRNRPRWKTRDRLSTGKSAGLAMTV